MLQKYRVLLTLCMLTTISSLYREVQYQGLDFVSNTSLIEPSKLSNHANVYGPSIAVLATNPRAQSPPQGFPNRMVRSPGANRVHGSQPPHDEFYRKAGGCNDDIDHISSAPATKTHLSRFLSQHTSFRSIFRVME